MNAHYNALNLRLFNERARLAEAKSEGERELRKVWISQIEKEIAQESNFAQEVELSDDELLAELGL